MGAGHDSPATHDPSWSLDYRTGDLESGHILAQAMGGNAPMPVIDPLKPSSRNRPIFVRIGTNNLP